MTPGGLAGTPNLDLKASTREEGCVDTQADSPEVHMAGAGTGSGSHAEAAGGPVTFTGPPPQLSTCCTSLPSRSLETWFSPDAIHTGQIWEGGAVEGCWGPPTDVTSPQGGAKASIP